MEQQVSLLWQPCPTGVRVLRVYGDTPCPVLPATVDGRAVTELGPYCFSAREPAADGQFWAPDPCAKPSHSHPIGGDFVQEVTLPDSLCAMHNAAFYNCRALRVVSVGSGALDLGSDLFTNCRALQTFVIRAQPQAPTGLRRLLAAVSADVSAAFCPDGVHTAARLFYPEYSEFLDENTPAHIFNHSIQGIGYRYRQCFAQDAVQFAEYDAAFLQADAEEPVTGLCRIALDRLLFPCALSADSRSQYEAYLRAHPAEACADPIAKRDAGALRLLVGLLDEDARRQASLACGQAGWGEGAALLLAGGARRPARRSKKYTFDDLEEPDSDFEG